MKYLLFCLFLITSCNPDDNNNSTSIFKVEDIDTEPTCSKKGYMHFHKGDSRYEYGDVILCDNHLCRIIKKY